MGRFVLALALAAPLAACSSPSDQELENVKAARTVLSEWALAEDRAASKATPLNYTEGMRGSARDQLVTARDELDKQHSPAAAVIQSVLWAVPDAAQLRAADRKLAPLEVALERP